MQMLFIIQVMRYACLVYAVPHATTDDVCIAGYSIPSGTTVYANMWRVMHSEDYWDDHDAFSPERFIDQETGAFRCTFIHSETLNHQIGPQDLCCMCLKCSDGFRCGFWLGFPTNILYQ